MGFAELELIEAAWHIVGIVVTVITILLTIHHDQVVEVWNAGQHQGA
jgi:hypothetical protein